MTRRDLWKSAAAAPAAAAQLYAQRTRGLPPLTIKEVKVIGTSANVFPWVFIKVITSEPGLYGLGSANNLMHPFAVVAAIEKNLGPFWAGKEVDRIEDIWQATNLHSYFRNGMLLNAALAAIDMALWDIKAKRAGMPVYELLGGKVRDAISLYTHADGRDHQQLEDSVRKAIEAGYRFVRAQLGGYGGGGMIPPGQGRRAEGGYAGPAFDEDLFVKTIPKAFEHLRAKVGDSVKLLYDVHEKLNPNMAVEFVKRMEPYQLYFVEDPLPPEQIAWFQHMRHVTTTPLAMGEIFTHPLEYIPLVSQRLIDFVRCRLCAIGGITPLKKLAGMCEAFGVRTAFQQGGEPDPIHQMATYHVEISSPSFGVHEQCRFPELIHEMMPGTAEIKGGYLYGNRTPGLGVNLNETIAAKYPLKPYPHPLNWLNVNAIDGSIVRP
ncbi:MAG: enolase C-terminal domain-like protein [Bryobacteraceae bacterium]